jgi:hypothetical protein
MLGCRLWQLVHRGTPPRLGRLGLKPELAPALTTAKRRRTATFWIAALLAEAVPFAENYLRARKARLEAGIDGRDWREVPFDEAVKLGKQGRPKKGEEKGAIGTLKRGTNSRAYILARLDRDGQAELAAKVRAGTLSANAAAIEAGTTRLVAGRGKG